MRSTLHNVGSLVVNDLGLLYIMSAAIRDVLIASSTSVAKVFIISAVGYFSVKRPVSSPFIPATSVNTMSRFSFNLLYLPLIYASLGRHLTLDILKGLWFVIVGGLFIIPFSYATSTTLARIPWFQLEKDTNFDALRIASSFPNVVAVPLLIFPSLCEYSVVYNGVVSNTDMTSTEKVGECISASNAMVFAYFFTWVFLFHAFGEQKLLAAARRYRQQTETNSNSTDHTDDSFQDEYRSRETKPENTAKFIALRKTVTSPGFVCMVLGVITALIAPLQEAMFEPGGALRFLGSAVDSLAVAAPSVMTLFAAASLVQPEDMAVGEENNATLNQSDLELTTKTEVRPSSTKREEEVMAVVPERNDVESSNNDKENASISVHQNTVVENKALHTQTGNGINDESQDPTRGNSSVRRFSIRGASRRLSEIRRLPSFRMHVWFCASKLLITPALVCVILIGLDCGTSLFDSLVPHYSKFVLLLNSCLPGYSIEKRASQ